MDHELAINQPGYRHDLVDCELCRRVLAVFSQRDARDVFDLTDVYGKNSPRCIHHEQFFRYCRKVFCNAQDTDCSMRMHREHPSLVELRNSRETLQMALLEEEAIPGHTGKGRLLDSDWVDLELAREWKTRCLSTHGLQCQRHPNIPLAEPLCLIDTSINALSLQRPSSLLKEDIASRISPIIKRVIHVVREMNERYLWVDALCIMQDDKENVSANLALMASIYASAQFTIVASDGDASDGLEGLAGVSPSRSLTQTIIPIGSRGERVIVHETGTGFRRMTSGSPYYDRGWTYQEYFMSSRRLVFRGKILHWEYGHDVCRPMQIILGGAQCAPSLETLIGNYNERQFRYEQDALPGIMGMLSVLSRSFVDGFLFGLPEGMFDAALTWHQIFLGPKRSMRRRVATAGGTHSAASMTQLMLSSWSWVGWAGRIDLLPFEEGLCGGDSLHYAVETIPITTWFANPRPGAGLQRQIRSTWFQTRSQLKRASGVSLDGWKIENFHSFDPPHMDQVNDGDALLCVDSDTLRLCKPPAGGIENGKTILQDLSFQTPYISCRTDMVRLWAYREEDGEIDLVLRDRAGSNVGTMLPNSSDDADAVLSGSTALDLVAICKQRIWEKMVPTSDVYVVLWVEWLNGVAYRKGVGIIPVDEWARLEALEVDLILG
ncbi:hypothetical protein HJFPF1_05601 [Paramyrothecium foliicola]|nr:hypothetical protein HJFPF1_05601 [Paramyrothecium foliicola]